MRTPGGTAVPTCKLDALPAYESYNRLIPL